MTHEMPREVETLTIEVVPFEPDGAPSRVLAAARDIGLVGVVLPVADDGVLELLVAARASDLRVVRDGGVGSAPAQEVVEALRMRCAASVACLGPSGLVAESVLPAALERAQEALADVEAPTVVAAIAPTLPHGLTAGELAVAFGADVVDVVVDGRQLVVGRPAHPIVWAPAARPVVAVHRTPTSVTAAVWTRRAVRIRQSPIAREDAMIVPDLSLAWILDPERIVGADAPDEARVLQDAVVAQHRPRVDEAGLAVVRPALAELGLDGALDELVALAESPLTDETPQLVVVALGLPPVAVDLLHDRIRAVDLPGANVTEHRGVLRTLGSTFGGEMRRIAAEELGPDWRDRDRRRRRWLAAVLAPLLAIGNLAVAAGAVPVRPDPNPWYLVPAVAFAGIAVWSIRWLVLDARRRRDVDDPSGAG